MMHGPINIKFLYVIRTLHILTIRIKKQHNAVIKIQQNRSQNTLRIGCCQLLHVSPPSCHHKGVYQKQRFVGPTRISVLITVQRDVTQSSLFIILQVHSTYFGCQPHPSSGVHKTVTTASGTGHIFVQLPPSNVAKHPYQGV